MKPNTVKPKGKIVKPSRIIFNPNNAVIVDPCDTGLNVIRSGKYAHYCYEWDEMLIDEHDPEFEACNCGKPNPRS
jgi:hypothetical protein